MKQITICRFVVVVLVGEYDVSMIILKLRNVGIYDEFGIYELTIILQDICSVICQKQKMLLNGTVILNSKFVLVLGYTEFM